VNELDRLGRVTRFSRIFGSARSLEDVCRAIVQADEFKGLLYGTQIHSLTNRGTLVSAAVFGMESHPESEKLTLFDSHPLSDAARDREIKVVPHPMNSDFAIWAMPILKDDLTAGTLKFSLNQGCRHNTVQRARDGCYWKPCLSVSKCFWCS